METTHRTFERHSYEPELAGFADLHHDIDKGAFIVTITDCLSGGQAGASFLKRGANAKASRYRADELDHIGALEARHRGSVYIGCHSHVDILPDELVDCFAGSHAGEGPSELVTPPPLFHLAQMPGVKRSVGRVTMAVAQPQL